MAIISDLAGSPTNRTMQAFSNLPVDVLYASAFVASALHTLSLGQDFAACVSGMRNV